MCVKSKEKRFWCEHTKWLPPKLVERKCP